MSLNHFYLINILFLITVIAVELLIMLLAVRGLLKYNCFIFQV